MTVIETGCHIEAPRAVVADRIRSLTDERQLDEVDRAWGRFMGVDAQGDEADYSVTAVDDATYRVSFREPPFAGTALFELEAVDNGSSTVVEVRVELDEAPLAVRIAGRLPGGRGVARRVVRTSLEEWLGEPDEVAAAQSTPPVIPHDPTRPAWDEPEVRHAVLRSVRLVALGWVAVLVAAGCGLAVAQSWTDTDEQLETKGERLNGVVAAFRPESSDEYARVDVTVDLDGIELEHSQDVERPYEVGGSVVVLHDRSSGESKVLGEDYEPAGDDLVVVASTIALFCMPVLGARSFRLFRTRRILRQPFVPVEIGFKPATARYQDVLVVVIGAHDDVRVFGVPLMTKKGRFWSVVDELEQGCLMAGTGRDRVLWKPGLGRVVRIAESRFAWRNARWRGR